MDKITWANWFCGLRIFSKFSYWIKNHSLQHTIINKHHKLHPPILEVRAKEKVSRDDKVDELDKLMDNEVWLKFINAWRKKHV